MSTFNWNTLGTIIIYKIPQVKLIDYKLYTQEFHPDDVIQRFNLI